MSTRILIVEDDYLARLDLEISMVEAGIEIAATASSAEEAVAAAAKFRPSMIIMDVRLQGNRTGIDAAIEIYNTMGIRSIITTAYDDSALIEQARAANPLHWVHKPYQTSVLVALVLAISKSQTSDAC